MKFLVPIGFAPQTDILIGQACNLAKKYNAEVLLLYVFDSSKGLFLFSTNKQKEESIVLMEEKIKLYKDSAKEKCGTTMKSLILDGKVDETIVSVAQSIDASYIIMGVNKISGLKSRFIGSNTMRVIKSASCPVITINGNIHRQGCSNLVLPLDLTKETTQKVAHAIDLAKTFGDTIIRAVSILNTNNEKVVSKIVEQMKEVRSFIDSEGIDCTAEIVKTVKGEDKLAKAVIAYANKVDGDLIMLMTQQELNPTDLFIGSKAQTIINESDIPVMSVLPQL